MQINDLIYRLAKETNMSLADIARSINESPQNFSNKLKRGTLSLDEFQEIADALNIDFNVSFKLKNNNIISINDSGIDSDDVLEFCIFCIEKLKEDLKISGAKAYSLLAEQTDILYSYIAKNFDVLHSQGEKYIVNDLKEILSDRINI